MFPLYDENPTSTTPIVTFTLIGLNVAAWAFVQGMGDTLLLAKSICLHGLIPGDLLQTLPVGTTTQLTPQLQCVLDGKSTVLSVFSSMFLHGGWLHIIGNMWFLWIFGDNIEDATGTARFAIFYLVCGLAAAAAQIISDPYSSVAMVGASGAIGGVMGAYARLYPKAHVVTLIPLGFFITTVALPAFVMLGFWFVIQILSGIPALGSTGGGVAFWAHVGGFLAGLILIGPMHRPELVDKHRRQRKKRSSKYRLF